MTAARRDRLVDAAVALVLACVVLGPLLVRRGYVLRGDMVFVPDQPWKSAWLGLDGRVPRFVPGDALLATLGAVLPGDLVQRLLLLGALVLAGSGAGRLVARHGHLPRAAAVVLFTWNPWVLERLAIGQWGVVVGYALLPWVALAVERLRDEGGLEHWAAAVAWLGLAAVFSPASGLVAVVVALGVLLARPAVRTLAGVLGLGVVVNLPWLLPSLLATQSLRPAADQFAAFAPRGESALGTAASVLTLGGIWKGSVVPGERTSAVVVGLALVVVAAAVAGLVLALRVERVRVLGLATSGIAALLLALLTGLGPVAAALDGLAAHAPYVGLLRDSHRYLGPFALLLVPGVAAATAWLLERAARPGREALRAVAVLLVAAPVLCLPSLAWGLGGDWRPVDYPREWYAVRDVLPPGRTVVLPWRGSYRGFDWDDRRAVLDPAPRFLPGDVLLDDRVYLGTRTLASEDDLLRDVARALDSSDPVAGLRRLGVRSVLLERGNGAEEPPMEGARVRHRGTGLVLWDLGVAPGTGAGTPVPGVRHAVIAVDVVVLTMWIGASGAVAVIRSRRKWLPRGRVSRNQVLGGRP